MNTIIAVISNDAAPFMKVGYTKSDLHHFLLSYQKGSTENVWVENAGPSKR